MREFTTIGYTFDELPQKVRDSLVNEYELSYDWYEFVKEGFHEKLESLGFYNVDSHFSGFWSQGDGASFSAKISMDDVKKLGFFEDLAKECDICIDPDLETSFEKQAFEEFSDATVKIETSGRYCHEYTMSADVWAMGTYRLAEFYGRNNSCAFLDYCRGLAREYYEALEKEYDYLKSEENVKEACEGNYYTIEGVLVCC